MKSLHISATFGPNKKIQNIIFVPRELDWIRNKKLYHDTVLLRLIKNVSDFTCSDSAKVKNKLLANQLYLRKQTLGGGGGEAGRVEKTLMIYF